MRQIRHFGLVTVLSLLLPFFSMGQIQPSKAYPELFRRVQTEAIFSDQKTFVDCKPLFRADTIRMHYERAVSRRPFNLRDFVGTHFDTTLNDTAALFRHIDRLWDYLSRRPKPQDSLSSLIALPKPYIVPGGRFREIYYWDSYFTMLGLQVSSHNEMIKNMVENFACLIDRFGHIPNGNRTYYLSRSQPPFFSLMVDLLAQIRGDSVYVKYLPQLRQEYHYWMQEKNQLKAGCRARKKVVLMKGGGVLNRYWDHQSRPRPESYRDDIELYKHANRDSSLFRDIRSAAESGWDFSSRWFADATSLDSIQTTHILPVDLNGLLYHLEKVLEKAYRLKGNEAGAGRMHAAANRRKNLIVRYFWDEQDGFFYDYHFKKGERTHRGALAGVYPLFFGLADSIKAGRVVEQLRRKYLFDGGLVTTPRSTGQQWDFPNGWAPLQWIAYKACKRYGYDELAHQIAVRWTDLNMKVFFNTGKMMEKYNVVNTDLPGGGGEYELQDGFGWTNGVFLKLWQLERGDIP